jgi:hypothetical protein
MLPVFSAAKTRTAFGGDQEHELTVSGSNSHLFEAWVKVGNRCACTATQLLL